MTGSRIDGVDRRKVEPHTDARGTLRDVWRRSRQPLHFEQALVTRSEPNALRGMHYHLKQSDLIFVPEGRIYLALIDLRAGGAMRSEDFWLDAGESVLAPPGVGHGYATVEGATVGYLLTREGDGSDEFGFRYDDPTAGIAWPVTDPTLSARDRDAGTLAAAIADVQARLGR